MSCGFVLSLLFCLALVLGLLLSNPGVFDCSSLNDTLLATFDSLFELSDPFVPVNLLRLQDRYYYSCIAQRNICTDHLSVNASFADQRRKAETIMYHFAPVSSPYHIVSKKTIWTGFCI